MQPTSKAGTPCARCCGPWRLRDSNSRAPRLGGRDAMCTLLRSRSVRTATACTSLPGPGCRGHGVAVRGAFRQQQRAPHLRGRDPTCMCTSLRSTAARGNNSVHLASSTGCHVHAVAVYGRSDSNSVHLASAAGTRTCMCTVLRSVAPSGNNSVHLGSRARMPCARCCGPWRLEAATARTSPQRPGRHVHALAVCGWSRPQQRAPRAAAPPKRRRAVSPESRASAQRSTPGSSRRELVDRARARRR